MHPIRVLLADDHTMFRQGLGAMFATDEEMEVVAEVGNGKEAIALAAKMRPDTVLMEVEMPIMSAQEAMERILAEVSPPPRVIIVTMHDDADLARRFVRLGASAYVGKSASLTELLSAVHAAVQSPAGSYPDGIPVVPQEMLEHPEEADELSARELEILLLVARGMSNREIAITLHISEATVKRHLANVYPKMKVGSRMEAASKALSGGWLSVRDISPG